MTVPTGIFAVVGLLILTVYKPAFNVTEVTVVPGAIPALTGAAKIEWPFKIVAACASVKNSCWPPELVWVEFFTKYLVSTPLIDWTTGA